MLFAIAAVTALAAAPLPLGYDDDVVRFLPADDPEVIAFDRIMRRFGNLDVALVAVDSTDAFTHDRLAYVRALTERLRALPSIAHVTSLTELAVVTGGAEASHVALVPPEIPTDPEALSAIRARVLALDYLVGLLVSRDGGATVLVTQLRTRLPNGEVITSKTAAEQVKAAALTVPAPADTGLHFAGAPFIAEAAANGSQDDLARLAPYVVGITLLLVILSLGSFWAAFYTVLTVGLSILWTLGLMGWLGLPLTLVSTSLPVILVALGSAYAVHILVWYREHDADLVGTLTEMGWPVLITALTTAAGFISFLVMDLAPMREFGWQMAAGAAIAAGLALTLVPALLALKPIPPRATDAAGVDRLVVRVALACRRRRAGVLGVAAVIAVGLATQLGSVDTRMDTSAFFDEDSAPARADRLMADKFGGSVFLQVLVDADIGDPAVLHRVAAFEDRLAGVPGVTRVESVAKVLTIVHEGLKGTRRTSRDRAEIEQLGFLARRTDPSVALLVDDAWRGALLQVAIGGFDTGVVGDITARVRALAAAHLDGAVAAVPRDPDLHARARRDAAERIAILADRPPADVDAIERALAAPLDDAGRAELAAAVRRVLEVEIAEDEMVALADPDAWRALADAEADALAAGRASKAALAARLTPLVTDAEREDPDGLDRVAAYLFTRVEVAATPILARATDVALAPFLTAISDPGRRLRVEAIADELRQPIAYVRVAPDAPGAHPVATTVSGQPIIQEAMTHSVQKNQVLSLVVSLPLVLLIMALVFRSLLAGFIGVLPAGLTLLVTFGVMGLLPEHLPMDIAASMLASIALGVGIDYAIHFMWRYRVGGLDLAMRTTGRAIVINAAEITGGFIVLAWASVAPMSRFGILTAQTLLVAAGATLVLLPALLTWWNPAGRAAPRPPRREDPMAESPRPRAVQSALPALLVAAAIAATALFAPQARADADFDAVAARGAQALLEESDRLTNHYPTQQWVMRMTVQPRGGEARVMEFRVWQKDQRKRLVRFDAPGPVKGMSMLAVGKDTMYVYSPQTDNVRRIAAHAKRQTLLGSNMSYDDMGAIDLSESYAATLGEATPTHQWLELARKPDAEGDTSWARLRVRVDKKTKMADVIEYFEGDKRLRVQTRSNFEVLDGIPTYRRVSMETLDDGLVTTLDVVEQKIGAPIADSIFQKRNLVRGN